MQGNWKNPRPVGSPLHHPRTSSLPGSAVWVGRNATLALDRVNPEADPDGSFHFEGLHVERRERGDSGPGVDLGEREANPFPRRITVLRL